MEAGNWGPHAGSASMWTCLQGPWMSVLPCMLTVPNRGIVTLYVVWKCPWTSSRQNSQGTVGSEPGEGVTSFPPPHFHLRLCRAAEATQTWLLQSGPVSRTQLPTPVSTFSSFPSPCQWFWTQPKPGTSRSRLWSVWLAARCPYCKLLYPGSVGMGWQSLWYPLVLTAYPEGGPQGHVLTEPRAHAGNLCPWVNYCGHPLPIYDYRGLIGSSYQAGNWVLIQKRNDWGSFSWACLSGCLHAGWPWPRVGVGM